jgi:hypothetical protein
MAKGATLEEAAAAVGIPVRIAKAEFVRSGLPVPGPLRRHTIPNAQAQQAFSPTAALLALRLLSHELGAQRLAAGRVRVTQREWDTHRDPTQHPSSEALVHRYGSWTAACAAAGVPVRRQRA